MFLTLHQIRRLGLLIKKGQRSFKRNSMGAALFHSDQLEPPRRRPGRWVYVE